MNSTNWCPEFVLTQGECRIVRHGRKLRGAINRFTDAHAARGRLLLVKVMTDDTKYTFALVDMHISPLPKAPLID